MKRSLFVLILLFLLVRLNSQQADSISSLYLNSAEKMLATEGKLLIGGYGEVHYNQPFDSKIRNNGSLDVHRMVMFLGYNFSSKTQFVSEIEYEHVSEVYIEQAFLQHRINSFINLRAGLLLVPMGLINEYHEPTTFNGVERPWIDTRIAPTTWREIGVGLSGNIIGASVKYQAYLINGFNGYNGKANLNGKNGLRNGRQKGAESYISSPGFTGKVEYYGFRGLNIGISGYFGKTQSTLYQGIEKKNDAALAKADSSVVGVSMIGVDARYNLNGIQLRGQLYYTGISNTDQYNNFTAVNGKSNDLGSAMIGYYLEAGYNVLKFNTLTQAELIPFFRYEAYNTHASTTSSLEENESYNNKGFTTGVSYKIAKGAVVKADIQYLKSKASDDYAKTFNVGFAIMF